MLELKTEPNISAWFAPLTLFDLVTFAFMKS
jgi:hypothetical protein